MQSLRVLVLCTGNACRSQMTEGYLHTFGDGQLEVYSAGLKPSVVHPLAIKVMAETGIDISGNTSNDVREYLDISFTYVITVCNNASQACPVFPGFAERLHWPFDDPAQATGTNEEILAEFRRVRDQIGEQCSEWLMAFSAH